MKLKITDHRILPDNTKNIVPYRRGLDCSASMKARMMVFQVLMNQRCWAIFQPPYSAQAKPPSLNRATVNANSLRRYRQSLPPS